VRSKREQAFVLARNALQNEGTVEIRIEQTDSVLYFDLRHAQEPCSRRR
jgi:hypothetical protein